LVRAWTDTEAEYVEDYAGYLSNAEMAQHLNKSENAIKLWRCRHGCTTFFDNVFTYTLLSRELGRSRSRIRVWVERGWIVSKRATWKAKFGKCPMLFKEEDIVKFLRMHHTIFDSKQIPNRYFRNIVREEEIRSKA